MKNLMLLMQFGPKQHFSLLFHANQGNNAIKMQEVTEFEKK